MTTHMTGPLLKAVRSEWLTMTQEELADCIEVNVRTLQRAENSKQVSATVAMRVTTVLLECEYEQEYMPKGWNEERKYKTMKTMIESVDADLLEKCPKKWRVRYWFALTVGMVKHVIALEEEAALP